MELRARMDAEGMSRLEEHLDLGLAGVVVGLWIGFLGSLRQPSGELGWFVSLAALHLLPLPIVLVGSETDSKQFFGWVAFGGLALILGLPHHAWPAGRRAWPRVVTTVAVGVGLGVLFYARRSLA
ncbi:MAG TPA: hypothetical protein VGB85_25565 [Nannocystis sp.]|jgi:hypothetical protein